ncbi:MAG TPA: hypothetical protein VKV16_02225, partial [Solirubrobacteraceae bacterium]|nr:hypothetical protein [Solirubrobacteraceae bacterium]
MDGERVLVRYDGGAGQAREVVVRAGAGGSRLVIDRRCGAGEDPRLVAHLAADEPPENATIVCRCYLRDLTRGAGRCRALSAQDETLACPLEDLDEPRAASATSAPVLRDSQGRRYSLELLRGRLSIPELRWCRRTDREE